MQSRENLKTDPAKILFDSFDVFASVPGGVKKLRELILQLAVQGKLVPQDPSDEPASVLLERISKVRLQQQQQSYPNENEAIVQAKKQKKQSILDGLSPLPSGWKWATLMQCASLVVDCHNKTAPYSESGIPLLRTSNIRDGKLLFSNLRFVTPETYKRWSMRCFPESGDILITREAPMGEVCIIPDDLTVCMGQRMMLIRLAQSTIVPQFLLYSLRDPNLMNRVQDKPVGATVQHLRVGGVETLLVQVPPEAEQHRIVAKVDQLMALCDDLEAKLKAAQDRASNLVGAVVAQFQGNSTIAPESTSTAKTIRREEPLTAPPVQTAVAPFSTAPPQPSPASGEGVETACDVSIQFLDMDPEAQAEAIFDALWCKGPLSAEEALRLVAEALRDRGLVEFKRLRKDGALGQAIVQAIQRGLKYGYLDKPKRGTIRAVVSDPKDYDDEDWRLIVASALGNKRFEIEDDAIRIAAEWVRENCGLTFKRLRTDGVIHLGLRKALRLNAGCARTENAESA